MRLVRKGMCSRSKSGGTACMQQAQAAPVASSEIKRKFESPEKYSRPDRKAVLEPLPESTIPFAKGLRRRDAAQRVGPQPTHEVPP